VRKCLRLVILRALGFALLCTAGARVSSALKLHPLGEGISDEIRRDDVHYDLLNLARVWLRIRPKTVIDVGANLGNHSHFFASKGAQVVAFEPSKANFALLEQNLKSGGGRSFNVAIGRTSGFAEIVFIAGDMGSTHVRGAMALESDASSPSELVALEPLDTFKINSADLVKIDVEGYELEVLAGAEETLRRCRPCVWLELHEDENLINAKVPYSRLEIISWLNERGFTRVTQLDPTNFLFRTP
jgi:FkbM family methyltransferase